MKESKSSSQKSSTSSFLLTLRVGLFLSWRQIRRASIWTNVLIIFIMILTFLNLVVVSGILVGLIEGASRTYRSDYSGDILVTKLPSKRFIEDSPRLLKIIESFPEVETYTYRYLDPGVLESNYKKLTKSVDVPDQASTLIAGINPEVEDQLTNISRHIVEGEYLDENDQGKILLGHFLMEENVPEVSGVQSLSGIKVGEKVRLTIDGTEKEFTVKGILVSKIESISFRAFLPEKEFRRMTGRADFNLDEIAIKIKPGYDPELVKEALLASGVGDKARVQTWEESQGKFFQDIKKTFNILGAAIGSIGLAVASITIFIVIYINAISRRKFIGIQKAIGISPQSIESAYIFQSIFYAVFGSFFGLLILYVFLIPFFQANPIDFPFSDGILVAPAGSTFLRILLLFATTLIAGYVPAKIVTRKNTLDSILGR